MSRLGWLIESFDPSTRQPAGWFAAALAHHAARQLDHSVTSYEIEPERRVFAEGVPGFVERIDEQNEGTKVDIHDLVPEPPI